MSTRVLSIVTYLLAGYLVGLMIGLTAFDPDTDLYALLGAALALIGVLMGLIPFFRRRVNFIFGSLIGFYLGMILAIRLWGNPQTDDLLEFLQGGGNRLLLAFGVAGIGGFLARGLSPQAHLAALTLLVGGFLGGALFVTAGAAPASSMVGLAPFVIGSGLVCALVVGLLTKSRTTTS